jgi:hypothetical protein
MHEEEQSVREQTNLLHKRSKGKRLMNNFDQITRRDFLSRVTTLAGGVVVATSAGLLAGCGSDNGSSGPATKQVPFPSQPAPPTPLTLPAALALAIFNGQLPAGSKITSITPIATVSDPTTVSTTVKDNLPPVTTYALSTPGGIATAVALNVTATALQQAVAVFLNQAGTTFAAGDVVETVAYSIGGKTYNSLAVVNSSGQILFDTFFSLLAPDTASSTLQKNASYDYSNQAVGQARYTAYNPSDGHLVLDLGLTATPNYDVNGNLSTTNPVTVAQASGTGSAGPGISLGNGGKAVSLPNTAATPKAVSVSSHKSTRDTITSITITITYTVGGVTFTVTVSVVVDVSTSTITTTTTISITETFAGIVIFSITIIIITVVNRPTGV